MRQIPITPEAAHLVNKPDIEMEWGSPVTVLGYLFRKPDLYSNADHNLILAFSVNG